MATPPTLALSLLSLLSLLATTGAQTSVKLGDVVHNLLFPSNELLGGFERVMNDINTLDNTVNSCGKRQVCEAMSLGEVIERSDGSLLQEAGLLRQAVDTAGEVVFQLARPFMEAAGLGRVARREQSVTEFLIDLIDSAIIGVTRVLAGRRLSRQLEEFSPVLSIVEPVSNVLRLIPKHFYGNIVDLAVDVTGVADRRSGGYNLVRSAGLGYFYGKGGEVCQNLNGDIFGGGPHCDDGEGKIHPLAMLNPINSKELGKTVRLGGGELNPLMDRASNANPTTHVSFDYKLTDLLEPTKILCRMDGVLGAVNGHVLVKDGDMEPLADMEDAAEAEEEALQETVSIRRVDLNEPIEMEELDEDSKLLVLEMKRLKNKVKTSRGSGTKQAAKTEMTSEEKFQDYCNKMNMEEIELMLEQKHNITMDSEEDDMEDNTEEFEDNTENYYYSYDVEPVVGVRKNTNVEMEEEEEYEEYVDSVDDQMTDIDTIARIGDRSLLSEKLEVEAGSEVEAVESLISRLKVAANGRVEKVLQLDRKKGEPVLLIQFDTTQYRDAVLKSSRMPGARSTTNVRFRRPKVKDLKHVVNLVRRH